MSLYLHIPFQHKQFSIIKLCRYWNREVSEGKEASVPGEQSSK